MNIAFPAFLIFLLVLPGIIFRYAYLRGRSINNPFVITSMADEIAYGVVAAAVLHTLWCSVFKCAHHPVDYKSVIVLSVGAYGEHQEYLSAALTGISRNAGLIAVYFLSLYAVSAILGLAAHEVVRTFRLDHMFSLLRFRNEWYYLLSGEYVNLPEQGGSIGSRRPDMVLLSTVIIQGGQAYIYRGYVVDYYFDRTGVLDRVVLFNVKRRRLENDRAEGQEYSLAGDERFYAIMSDLFVIKYSEMQTINVEGISFEVEATESISPAE